MTVFWFPNGRLHNQQQQTIPFKYSLLEARLAKLADGKKKLSYFFLDKSTSKLNNILLIKISCQKLLTSYKKCIDILLTETVIQSSTRYCIADRRGIEFYLLTPAVIELVLTAGNFTSFMKKTKIIDYLGV